MYLVAIAWMYVVVMMTVVEATSPNGTIIGAVSTFLLYGAFPLAIVLYILRTRGTPGTVAGGPATSVGFKKMGSIGRLRVHPLLQSHRRHAILAVT